MRLNRRQPNEQARAGFTLVELIAVVAILAILAGAIVPLLYRNAALARTIAAKATLGIVRDAIMGTTDKPGFLSDCGRLPNTIGELFLQPSDVLPFNRDTGLGWRGPYIIATGGTYPRTDAYGNLGDPAIFDPWGHPIILQIPNQLTSYGTASLGPPATAYASPLAADYAFARLISAGPNGVINTPQSAFDTTGGLNNPYPVTSVRGDDIVLFLNHSDSDP